MKLKKYFFEGYENYIYYHMSAIFSLISYCYFSDSIFILIMFLLFYSLLIQTIFISDIQIKVELFKYYYIILFASFLHTLYFYTEISFNKHINFIISFFLSVVFILTFYFSWDGISLQEFFRLNSTIFLIEILNQFTNRITFFVLFISLLCFLFYSVLGRLLMFYIFFTILRSAPSDSPVFFRNYFFAKLFFFFTILAGYVNKLKKTFLNKLLYAFTLRSSIWIIAFYFGSKNLFFILNIFLIITLFISSILEFFINNSNFTNILTYCLKKSECEKIMSIFFSLKDDNHSLALFYGTFSYSFLLGQDIDRTQAKNYVEFMKDEDVKKTRENDLLLLFLNETIITGENRYYNENWFLAENLSENRFDETGDLADNYVAGYLIYNTKERIEKLKQFSKKDKINFFLLENNKDSLIIKNPVWYINISSGLVI